MREKNKVHEGVNNMWRREIKDYREKYKAQERRRENKVKGKIKGAESAKGQQKIWREKTKSEGEKG